MNRLLLEYLKQETWRAYLRPDSLTLQSKNHDEILGIDSSMSGYEEVRLHVLKTMYGDGDENGWIRFDRYEDEIKEHRFAAQQIDTDKKFRGAQDG